MDDYAINSCEFDCAIFGRDELFITGGSNQFNDSYCKANKKSYNLPAA